MTPRILVWAGAGLLVLVVAAWLLGKPAPLVNTPSIQRDLPPVGTYQYLHVEGPLMLAWDTRTGAYKFCLIRPGEQGIAMNCGRP